MNNFVAMTRCYFCGKGKDILIHKNLRDISQVNNKVMDREPCPKCAELMKKGILLIATRDEPNGTEEPYRTGTMWAVTEDSMHRVCRDDHPMFKTRWSYISVETAKAIGLWYIQPNSVSPVDNRTDSKEPKI